MTDTNLDIYLEISARPPKDAGKLMAELWPKYLLEPSDLPTEELGERISAEESDRRTLVLSLRQAGSGQLVACAQGLAIEAPLNSQQYSPMGWRYVIQSFTQGAKHKSKVNTLCLVVVNVGAAFRGIGIPEILLEQAKLEAKKRGLAQILVPVRPTLKHKFPHESMEEYCSRKEGAEEFDPWLRTHVEAGGEILNICPESVVVKASLGCWNKWVQTDFPQSGHFPIPGGLAPLVVDKELNIGTYTEPNIWVRYLF